MQYPQRTRSAVQCSLPFSVVPEQNHAGELESVPRLALGVARDFVCVRNLGDFAVAAANLPLVERALNAAVLDYAAFSQMRAHMRAIRIQYTRLACNSVTGQVSRCKRRTAERTYAQHRWCGRERARVQGRTAS